MQSLSWKMTHLFVVFSEDCMSGTYEFRILSSLGNAESPLRVFCKYLFFRRSNMTVGINFRGHGARSASGPRSCVIACVFCRSTRGCTTAVTRRYMLASAAFSWLCVLVLASDLSHVREGAFSGYPQP